MSVGEYYYFFNEDGAKNEHGVSYSHGLPFVINLEKYYGEIAIRSRFDDSGRNNILNIQI